MTRYLIKVEVRPEAFAAFVKNPSDRAKAIAPLYEALGGKVEEYYFAVGASTIFLVAQAPDDISAEAIIMAALAGGAVGATQSTPILTAAEAISAMEKAREVAYRPPSS